VHLKILVREAVELKKITLFFFENSVAVSGMGRGPKIATPCSAPLFSHCEGKGVFHMVGCHIPCVQDVEIGSLGDVVLFIH
jgi:hypothetical protein